MPSIDGLRRLALAALTVLAAGACVPGPPPPPLMSPLAETGAYGYEDRRLADGRYEVTYTGPEHLVPVRREWRREETESAGVEARELALWRAAQLALQTGNQAFSVIDSRSDVEVEIHRYDYVVPHYYYPRYAHPFYYPFPHPVHTRHATARARAVLTVEMHRESTPGAIDAKETADKMRAKYSPPAATGGQEKKGG